MKKTYLLQWMDGAGIHEARLLDDLNGATTLAIALVGAGGCQAVTIYMEEEMVTKLVQRFVQ